MRKGRQIDRNWEVRRYKGDSALYAYCKCGFQYNCSLMKEENGIWKQHITKIYNYCPNCGAHKKWYNEIPRKIDKFPWDN